MPTLATSTWLIGTFIVIVCAFILSIIYVNLTDPFYKSYRKRRQKKDRTILFKGLSTNQIEKMASERRERILEFLDNPNYGFTGGIFIENPPGLSGENNYQYREDRQFAGHRAVLYNQIKNDELLLAERVVDTLLYFFTQFFGPTVKSFSNFPSVKVEHRRALPFPWTVIIETNQRQFWEDTLKPLEEWLAIRIEFADVVAVYQFGRCQFPDGAEGIVGGFVVANNDGWPMTCSHVVSSKCQSLALGTAFPVNEYDPDAVLLRNRMPCFPEAARKTRPLDFAIQNDITDFIRRGRLVKKLPPGRSRPKGKIMCQARGFPVGGVLYRFPHLQIEPALISIFGVFIWPLFNRRFSTPGQSGTWVAEETSNRFVGMIVVGNEYHNFAYIIESEPLIHYLRDNLRTSDIQLETFIK
jgi:hypothetical protein